jgi:hypothetical protein
MAFNLLEQYTMLKTNLSGPDTERREDSLSIG